MSFFCVKKRWRPFHFLSEQVRFRQWIFASCVLLYSTSALGSTITVTNTNSSGAGSLDQAIQDFISGGVSSTISFDASLNGSTITIAQAYSFSANSLVIDGDVNGDGDADITLQSDGTDHRFFSLSGTSAITFKNLQVENFSTTSDGGVVQISTGTVTIENCLIRNNTGRSGGVIYIQNGFGTGDANISKSIFSGNSASSFGGVIYQASFLSSVHTVIENSLFFNNTAPNSNGGVAFISDGSNFTLRHVTLSNNSSKFSGGAILNNNNLTIENSLIVGNSSESGPSNILNNRTFNNAGGSIVGGENGASDAVTDYFVDAANGDYNLISTSPAVNAGLNSLTTAAGITTDIVGNAQPNVGITSVVDAGAYEFLGDPPISFESSSVINSSTLTITLTFDRQISGLDNTDFTTATNSLSFTSLTSPDNTVYTATFTLADLTQRAVDTVFMDALVEDMFTNNLQAKDTSAFIYYVPVAQVTNTLTSGEGSFDQALQDFIDSEGIVNRVEFDPTLDGSTIMVTQGYTFSQGTLAIEGDIDDDGTIDVTLQSDGANHGFFIINGSTSLNLSRVQITDFSPSNQWGPVVQVNSGLASLSVEGCEIRNISTGGFGGAVYCENGSVSIKESIFDNSSAIWGGAVTIYGGNTTIENSLFINNSAGNGGAIYGRNGANVSVRHCTFSGNSATTTGGAIYNLRTLTVENSLFVGNEVNSTVNNITNAATFNDNGGNIYGGESSTSNDLADYFTDAANDDYTLHLRSLATDQGVNALATNAGITTDLLGNTRPFSGLAQIVDVGAYELQADPDFVAPTIALSTTSTDPTNDNPIPVSITFSESVTGFTSADIVVNGGSIQNFTGSGANYAFDLIPTADGTPTVDVASNVATDAAGNGNTTATQLSVTYDGTRPTVSLATTSSSPTNSNTIPVTITFSESITGFESGDLTVSGATIENFTGSGADYSFDLIPTGDGSLTVDVASDVAMDAAGNGNTASTQLSVIYDGTEPAISISSTSTDPTNDHPIPVTITFSESVTGFESGDLTVNGGTIENFTGSGTSYSFDLLPSSDGTLTVDVTSNVAMDAVGNGNTAATQWGAVYDGTAPTVSLSTSSTNPTNDHPIPVTVTFSESVTGFVSEDVVVSGGTIENFAGSSTNYSFDLIPDSDGTLTVDVASDVALDAAGNGNTSATQLSVSYDGTAPTISLSSTSMDPTNDNPIPVTIIFSESVTGFTSEDVIVSGGTIENFTGSSTSYSFDLIPDSDGTLTVDVAEGVATDAVGNDNTAATQLSVEYNVTSPTVSLATTSATATNNSTIPVTITFSESVTGFNSEDVVVSGGALENFTGSSTSYSFDLIPDLDGTLTVDVAEGVATDAAGNGNAAATQLNLTYDGTAPSVSISTSATAPTNDNPIPITITFSESVTGFAAEDIVVSGGAIENFTGSSSSYSFNLIPDSDGMLTVDVAADVTTDAAGNGNVGATQLSVSYDGTAPSVSISTSSIDPTNDNPIPTTITFSESVTGFVAEDIVVSGGAIENFTGSSSSYSFDLVPDSEGMLTVDVAADVATDAAGNGNAAATQLNLTYDGTAPSVSISTSSADPTNDNPIPIMITFSESVTGFVAEDIVVSGGAIENFAGSSTSYSFDLIPATDGTLTVDVASSVAMDAAGNGNIAATQFRMVYDNTAPVVTVDALNTSDNSPSITGTIDDPEASIVVTVDGQTVSALNQGDGTWIVEDNSFIELGMGTYDVMVTATDRAQNLGSDDTTDELIIENVLAVNNLPLALEVYPNPTTERLFISGTIDFQEIESVRVFNGQGAESEVQYAHGQLEVSALPAGIYFLKIQVRGELTIKRFIKH